MQNVDCGYKVQMHGLHQDTRYQRTSENVTALFLCVKPCVRVSFHDVVHSAIHTDAMWSHSGVFRCHQRLRNDRNKAVSNNKANGALASLGAVVEGNERARYSCKQKEPNSPVSFRILI